MTISSIRTALCLMLFAACAAAATPVKVIFDTDMDTDCDDAGALGMLHALADRGEVEILATMVSSKLPASAPCTDAINTFYGRGDLPIGVPKGDGASTHRGTRYADHIAAEFPHDLPAGDGVPDAVDVYREVLAAQGDHSVVIVSVGYLTNISDLLQSPADAFSSLNGRDLVARKVVRWVCMGGDYPRETRSPGDYGNFWPHPEATKYAVDNWPVEVVFSGAGIGGDIHTGRLVRDSYGSDHPVARAYDLYLGSKSTRPSWDQTAVLYAARGAGDYWDLITTGTNTISDAGTNTWVESPDSDHIYLEERMADSEIAAIIDELMVQPPAGGDDGGGSGDGGGASDGAAHWRFDESGGSAVVDSLGDHDGILVGGDAARVGGVAGGALRFGDGRWVDVPSDPAFATDAISFAAWIRLDAGAGDWRALVEHDRRGGNWYGLFIRQNTTRIHFRWGVDPGSQTLDSGRALEVGRWYHLAATYDPDTGRAAIYLDGELDATGSGPAPSVGSGGALRIGANLAGAEAFPGAIDDLHLRGAVLSATEVATLADLSEPEPEPEPEPGIVTILEAEDALLLGPVARADHGGHTGSGYADYLAASGDRIVWDLDVAAAGDHELAFRYALGAGARPLRILVDGTPVAESLDFPGTGSWSSWSTVAVVVHLDPGAHQVTAEAIGDSGANLDHLAVTAAAPGSDPGVPIAINLQPASAPVPAGYLMDAGDVFGDRGDGWSYGWNARTDEARDRGRDDDQVRDTLNHLQKPSNPDATWEIALVDGWYQVDLLCGDPSYTDQLNHLLVEGIRVADPDGEDHWDRHLIEVEVRDGRLTVGTAGDARNAKLAAIVITPLVAADG